jgi:hypothetical protein
MRTLFIVWLAMAFIIFGLGFAFPVLYWYIIGWFFGGLLFFFVSLLIGKFK